MAGTVEATQQGDEYETWTADPPEDGAFYRFDVSSGVHGASGVLLIDGKQPGGVRGWTVRSHVDGVATVVVEFIAASINRGPRPVKVFVWEGDGISNGYHDDGTLVVLAETPEQARELAIASAPVVREEYGESFVNGDSTAWLDGRQDGYYRDASPLKAIQREPDRVVELDEPRVVAFNGGGRD